MTARNTQSGFSLVELMVALLVGLILLAGLVSLFIETSANIAKTERQSALNTEGQFALSFLAHELEMAGFWSRAFDPSEIVYDNATMISSQAIDPDCGSAVSTQVQVSSGGTATAQTVNLPWSLQISRPLEQYDDQDSGTTAETEFPCLAAGTVQSGTDVLAIRRVSGGPLTVMNDGDPDGPYDDNTHTDAHVYLRSDSSGGGLYKYRTSRSDAESPRGNPEDLTALTATEAELFNDWAYVPKVFYIRNYTKSAGDNIPSLCYEHLEVTSGTAGFASECIAEGIEDLQFTFGIDTNFDAVVDYYVTDPTTTEATQVATVRVHLLARSARPYFRFANQNTYVLGEKTVTKNDSFFRQVFSTTVPVHNPTRLRAVQ